MDLELGKSSQTELLSALFKMQNTIEDTLNAIASGYDKQEKNKPMWASLLILNRVLESSKAGVSLLSQGFDRDCVVLLTNQMELRLDLLYISLDCKRAEKWVNHVNEYKKPWGVNNLIEKIFKKGTDIFESEKNLYKNYSGVKHGNPAVGAFKLPEIIKTRDFQQEQYSELIEVDLYTSHLMALTHELYGTFKAAAVICFKYDIDISESENQVDSLYWLIIDLFIQSGMDAVVKSKTKPELCSACLHFNKQKIEPGCFAKIRQFYGGNFTCNHYKPQDS